jgi:hypothetical protein
VSALAQTEARGRRVGLVERRIAFNRGLYATQIERLLQWFPRDQLLVFQYEACVRDPGAALRRTYEAIGLDPAFAPDDITRPVHRTDRPKPVLDAAQRDDLAAAYAPDLQRLPDLCPEIDLTLWASVR